MKFQRFILSSLAIMGMGVVSPVSFADASDISSKIESSAISPITQKNYPKTYKLWGKQYVQRINDLFPIAAQTVAQSNRCDKVVWVSLSEKRSTPKKEAVFLVQCKNNERFFVSENDLNKPAKSVQEQTQQVDSTKYSNVCFGHTQKKLDLATRGTNMIASYEGVRSIRRTPGTGRVVVIQDWEIESGKVKAPLKVTCTFDERGLIDVKME